MSDSYHNYTNYAPTGSGNQYGEHTGYGNYGPPAPQGSTDPIISRLRARDVAGLVDQAFRLYRKHFLTFLAIIAVVHVPLQVLIQVATIVLLGSTTGGLYGRGGLSSGAFNPSSTTNEFVVAQLLAGVAVVVLYGLYAVLLSFSQGALTAAVADSYLDKPVSFGGAYRQVGKRIGPLFGLMLLQALIAIGIFVPSILLFVFGIGLSATGSNSGGVGIGLACLGSLLLLAGVGFYAFVNVRLRAAVPALMIENLRPTDAMRRSWRLLDGYWWRTVGITMLLAVISWVVASGPATLVSLAVTAIAPLDFVMRQAVTGAVTVLTTAVFIPIQLVALTLYYFDIRVRREGFDLETAMSRQFPGYGGQQTAYGDYSASVAGYQAPTMQPPALGYGQQQTQPQENAYTPPRGATYPLGTDYAPPTEAPSGKPPTMPPPGEAPSTIPESAEDAVAPSALYAPAPEWLEHRPSAEDTKRGENEG